MKKENFKILFVDDEPQNLVSFKAAFRRHYKNIFTAISAKEGMDVLQMENIHLIISDQRMPEMTGVQFLHSTINDFPDTIRMILTGFSDIEAIKDAINSGMVFKYIEKPWDERDLLDIIDKAFLLIKNRIEEKEKINNLEQKVKQKEKEINFYKKHLSREIIEEAEKIFNNL